ENGVAGSGFVAAGDAYGLTQRNASGHEYNPQLREFTAQYSGSGVSPLDCFALRNDAKLRLRELTVDGTVRVCVYLGVAASYGVVWSCGGLLSRRVWNCDSSQRTCAALHACFLLLFTFYRWFCCLPGIMSIVAVPLFNGRLLHTVMSDAFLLLVFCCPHAVPASLLCVPRTARKEDWRNRPDAAMKCEGCCVAWWNSKIFF
ncbi:hypothetical protein TcCL_NonESM11313, partial [Trypanosoma cruzi]